MITQFVSALLLLALFGGSQAKYAASQEISEEVSFLDDMIEPYAACDFGEVSCSFDCANVEICLGGEALDIVEVCAAGSMCDASTLTCSTTLAKCNVIDTTKLTCHGVVGGRFPNPFDCHSYFECPEPDPLVPAPVVDQIPCRLNTTAYDPLSGTCRLPVSHRVCTEKPVPKCLKVSQSGGQKENPNIFYVCVSIEGVLQPILSKCPDESEIFVNGKCTTDVGTTDDPSTTTEEEPTTESPENQY